MRHCFSAASSLVSFFCFFEANRSFRGSPSIESACSIKFCAFTFTAISSIRTFRAFGMNYAQDRLDRRARSGNVNNDYRVAMENKDHALLATALRDVGWNRQALFHYCQAWILNPESASAAGDYAQMAEFTGYAELGAIAIGLYRNKIPPTNVVQKGSCCAWPSHQDVDPVWLDQDPSGKNCGCGNPECGSELIFPFQCKNVTDFLGRVDDFLRESSEMNGSSPSAHDVLSGRDSRSHRDPIPIHPKLAGAFRLEEEGAKYCKLPIELQLLWTKLMYMICPFLAVHLVTQINRDSDAFSLAYKSHWAYQTFLNSLVLGARIKPHRIQFLSHYHEPVWNVMHGCTSAHRKRLDPPTNSVRSSQVFVNDLEKMVGGCLDCSSLKEEHRINWWLPEPLQYPPLYVIGDSHVLSLAWQTLEICDQPRLVVPVIVTGLKAWHVQRETRFFTQPNLDVSLRRMRPEVVLFSAGEIDCREGLGGVALEGYTSSCIEHLERTVQAYVQGLKDLLEHHESLKHILVLPIAKHSHRKTGRVEGQIARRETSEMWNCFLRDQLKNQQNLHYVEYIDELEALRIKNSNSVRFDADSTHLNSAFAPLLEKAVSKILARV